jgi:hypothetical protein
MVTRAAATVQLDESAANIKVLVGAGARAAVVISVLPSSQGSGSWQIPSPQHWQIFRVAVEKVRLVSSAQALCTRRRRSRRLA